MGPSQLSTRERPSVTWATTPGPGSFATPWDGLLLAAVYIGILLLGWVAIAIAILGLASWSLLLRVPVLGDLGERIRLVTYDRRSAGRPRVRASARRRDSAAAARSFVRRPWRGRLFTTECA